MSYNVIQLILDVTDGTGTPIGLGAALLAPSAQLTDATDNLFVTETPVYVQFPGAAFPSVKLIATDNAAVLPSGWAWTVSFQAMRGAPPAYDFFLPASPQTFTATDASPCVFTGSGSGYLNNTGVQLSGGSLPDGFAAGTTYWVVNASGSAFELAATVNGTPLASTSTGSGSVTAVSSYLSSLTPVSSVTTMAAYMPLPSGTPSAGAVAVATGHGNASAWSTGVLTDETGGLLS